VAEFFLTWISQIFHDYFIRRTGILFISKDI